MFTAIDNSVQNISKKIEAKIGSKMNITENIVGLTATILYTIAFVPQVMQINDPESSVSIPMYFLFVFSTLFWLAYAFITGKLVLIIANIIMLIFSLYILIVSISKLEHQPSWFSMYKQKNPWFSMYKQNNPFNL